MATKRHFGLRRLIARNAGSVSYVIGGGESINLRVDAGDAVEFEITYQKKDGKIVPAYLNMSNWPETVRVLSLVGER